MERTRKVSGAGALAKARRGEASPALPALEGAGAATPAEEAAAAGPRYREDGFTPERRRTFLAALGERGCVRDAAKLAGVSAETVRRHRRLWPDFDADCKAARRRAAKPLAALAYERATVGAVQKIVRDGKVVEERIKPSDALMRMLLQATDPDRFGRPGGHIPDEKIAQLKEKLREEIEEDMQEEGRVNGHLTVRKILSKINGLHRRQVKDEGWGVTLSGVLVPPGYGPVAPGAEPMMEDPLASDWATDRQIDGILTEIEEAHAREGFGRGR